MDDSGTVGQNNMAGWSTSSTWGNEDNMILFWSYYIFGIEEQNKNRNFLNNDSWKYVLGILVLSSDLLRKSWNKALKGLWHIMKYGHSFIDRAQLYSSFTKAMFESRCDYSEVL